MGLLCFIYLSMLFLCGRMIHQLREQINSAHLRGKVKGEQMQQSRAGQTFSGFKRQIDQLESQTKVSSTS